MSKNKKIIFIFLVIVIVGIIFFFEKGNDPNIARPYVSIRGEKIFVEIADTEQKRERGLSGRDSIGENEGMLFLFSEKGKYGFWMKEMNFPIDIIWMSGDVVVNIEKNVNPQIGASEDELTVYSPPEDADKVLEVRAGKTDRLGIKTGDVIVMVLYYY